MQVTKKLPYKDVEEAIIFFVRFGNGLGKSLEDKRFRFLDDIMNFAPAVTALFDAAKGAENILPQALDLDAEERAAISEKVINEFDIPQEQSEEFIEDVFGLILGGQNALGLFPFVLKWFVGEKGVLPQPDPAPEG